MKIIVTHVSPDWDAITSVWAIQKFLPGWSDAQVEFVPAGNRSERVGLDGGDLTKVIEFVGSDEIVHVDTGLGPLDHHQTSDKSVSAASLAWNYVKDQKIKSTDQSFNEEKWQIKEEAVDRIVKIVVDIDHFKEVFWAQPAADYHEFSLIGLLEGMKTLYPDQDEYYLKFGIECLDAMMHNFESRIWAEREIAENGKAFETKWGKGMGFETINDTVLKLAQKMGYVLVLRKDPRKGYVRIKARPMQATENKEQKTKNPPSPRLRRTGKKEDIDLTRVYEKLKAKDPQATWFLHVSKKMLLNGTAKNPKMKPTTLSLDDIIEVIKNV